MNESLGHDFINPCSEVFMLGGGVLTEPRQTSRVGLKGEVNPSLG